MSDMLADAMVTLASKMKTYASKPCTYRRGSSSCTVNFTAGSQILRVTDEQGGTKIERPDLAGTFTASELDFGSGQVEPKDGDLIDVGSKRYRLHPTNQGREPSWRYCDAGQAAVRIFAKFVTRI